MPLPVFGGSLIGTPGSGSHSFSDPPNNWESDEAIDIGLPTGSPVFAVAQGTIGPAFGALPGGEDPGSRFHGLRLHLQTQGDEFYYAHLDSFVPGLHPGSHVRAGDLLGYSGEAAGVQHLHFAEEQGYPSSGSSAPVMRFAPGGVGAGGGGSAGGGSGPGTPPDVPSGGGDGGAGVGGGTGGTGQPSASTCQEIAQKLIPAVLDGNISMDECTAQLNASGCQGSCTATGWSDFPGAGLVTSPLKALGFLFSFRGVELLAGLALIIVGVSALSRSLGGPGVGSIRPGGG